MAGSTRGRRFPVEPLNGDEFGRLLDACGRHSATSLRNRALLVVMYRAGLRVSEALALEVHDIDRERNLLNVRNGKGGKQRFAAIDAIALDVVDRWLTARRRIAGTSGPVFCAIREAQRGGRMQSSQVRHMMKRLGRKAGIAKRVHPHGLRHTHATELALERRPMHMIQRQLGHESLATTERYLRRVAPVELGELMRDRAW